MCNELAHFHDMLLISIVYNTVDLYNVSEHWSVIYQHFYKGWEPGD